MLVILMRIMASPSDKNEHNEFRKQVGLSLLSTFLASYYWSVLVIQKLTPINNENLRKLDSALKAWNDELYYKLDTVKCLGLKYIKYWRRTNLTIIPSRIYCMLRKFFRN